MSAKASDERGQRLSPADDSGSLQCLLANLASLLSEALADIAERRHHTHNCSYQTQQWRYADNDFQYNQSTFQSTISWRARVASHQHYRLGPMQLLCGDQQQSAHRAIMLLATRFNMGTSSGVWHDCTAASISFGTTRRQRKAKARSTMKVSPTTEVTPNST